MQLQTYAKIGICAGIAALALFTIMWIVGASEELQENWLELTVDKNTIMKKMKALPSVVLFLEKYENHFYLEHQNRHNLEIEIKSFDSTTGNELELNINYNIRNERFEEYVRCDTEEHHFRQSLGPNSEFDDFDNSHLQQLLKQGRAQENNVRDFIEFTNCLEMGKDTPVTPEIITPQYGEIPTYRISVPQGSSVPGCEEIAHCFEPEEITIKVGDIIEWKNYDDAAHTITSGDSDVGPTDLFDSGLAPPDAVYALKFNTPGVYPYFCMIHPWQEGTITVTK